MNASDCSPGAYYARRVVVPEVALFVSTLLLIGLCRLCAPSVGGFLAFVVAGCALWLDRRLFALVPDAVWSVERRKGAAYAALGAAAVFAFLLLGVLLSARFSGGLFLIAWLVRAGVPGAFSLSWYRPFARDIYPHLQSTEHQQSLDAFDRRTAVADRQAKLADAVTGADTRREDAARRGRRVRAMQEARSAVLNFYRSFAAVLRPIIGGDRLQVELRAAIPEGASEEQAFAGACGLLTRLEGVIHGAEAERKAEHAGRQQRRQQVVGIEAQVAAIGEEIHALRRNTAADPELCAGEIQSLDAKRRSLLEQRALLFSSVA